MTEKETENPPFVVVNNVAISSKHASRSNMNICIGLIEDFKITTATNSTFHE